MAMTSRRSHVDVSPSIARRRPTTLALLRLIGGHATLMICYDENSAGDDHGREQMPALSEVRRSMSAASAWRWRAGGADTYAALWARQWPTGVRSLSTREYPPRFHSRYRRYARGDHTAPAT